MCLITEKIEGEVSDKPIKCYKVYRKTKEGELESFYKYAGYDLKEGNEVVAEGVRLIDKDVSISRSIYTLSSGFIHAWKRQEDCIHMLFAQLNYMLTSGNMDEYMRLYFAGCEGFCFCEMEIPAGEEFWIGKDGGVCAERMIYRGVIRTVTNDELEKMAQKVHNYGELMRRLTEMFNK